MTPAVLDQVERALAFYADFDTYEPGYEPLPCGCCSDLSKPIENDAGATARKALSALRAARKEG